jgi:hypothetical protein
MNTLIGHNGLVGSNLIKYEKFHLYNSKNINDLNSVNHNEIWCCAPSAEKWKINSSKEEALRDKNNIDTILNNIAKSNFKEVKLFSSIDVYDCLVGLDEEYDIQSCNHDYGKNRLYFESEIKKLKQWNIIRLPGLFGDGLKKNVIFDLLNNNVNQKINLNDSYQWYFLDWLYEDVKMINTKNNVYNFFTESVPNEKIIDIIGVDRNEDLFYKSNDFKFYNLTTKNSESGFIRNAVSVLDALSLYVKRVKDENK